MGFWLCFRRNLLSRDFVFFNSSILFLLLHAFTPILSDKKLVKMVWAGFSWRVGEFSVRGQSVSVLENVRLKNWVLDIWKLSTFSKTTHSSLDKDSNSNQSSFIPLLPTTNLPIHPGPSGAPEPSGRPKRLVVTCPYIESFPIDRGLWDGNNCDYEPMTIHDDHTTAMGSRPDVLVLFWLRDRELFSLEFSRKSIRSPKVKCKNSIWPVWWCLRPYFCWCCRTDTDYSTTASSNITIPLIVYIQTVKDPTMLVTVVGDEMCWWQVWDVGDRFNTLENNQHTDSATNILTII